ncbi:hypothetical protein [Acinetobacter indicus]|uniref:hypothetical protein n=1 Tax=Acinetobacter indicus TaxID=756892 RepID=UPI0039890579
MTIQNEDYYFVSVGEKSYFYTLNYSYIHIKYVKSGIEQRPFPVAERRYQFLRNLSHDFDEAMEKAKQWHSNSKSKNPLKLLDSPRSMSEREKHELQERTAVIEAGYLPVGKFQGQHVSTVDIDYIHWVCRNVYDPELADGEQNLMAQICFNYADEQGWIDQWTQQVQDEHFGPEVEDQLNSALESDVLLVGKYRGQSLKDFGYTKKGSMKVKIADYIQWFRKQMTVVDIIINKFKLEPQLMDDGFEYYIIKSEHFLERAESKPSDYDLTVLMLRQMNNRQRNAKLDDPILPLYRFEWNKHVMPLKQALALSKCK